MGNTALLIIDTQNEMFDESNPVYKSEQLLENIQALSEKARPLTYPLFTFSIMTEVWWRELTSGKSIRRSARKREKQ